MPDEPPSRAPAGTPRRRGRPARRRIVRVIVLSMLALAMVTVLGVVFFVRHLNGNITGISTDALGEDRPEKVYRGNGEPLNILLMGSDSREGENKIDDETGGGSDTTVLVHLSADRSRAYAVSIPRDSIVDRPDCEGSGPASKVMWNAAFTVGGPLCTVAQLEENTDVFVDHFVVVDFNGFGDMVDAVGGVPVCVPEVISDPEHDIFVPKGDPALLVGDQALDYFRARYVGEPIEQNDISRIRRQQAFIAALVRKVKSAGTLTRIDRVIGFLNAATTSLKTDEDFKDVTRIGRVAMQLQSIGLDKVRFVTLPTEYYASDSELRGKVFWTPEATQIWRLLNRDEELPARLLGTSIDAEPSAGSSEGQRSGRSPDRSPDGSAGTSTPSAPAASAPSEVQTFGVCG